MGQKIIVGPIEKGLRNDRTAFVIDNDSFPTLINAYQWRGRVKRKRGTSLLNRLSRFLGTTDGAGNLLPLVTIAQVPILTGIVSFTVGTDVFYDPGTTADPGTQTLITNGAGTGTLNRVTGVLTITGSQINTPVIYFPTLPVMGIEDLLLIPTEFPGTLAFDTKYSYNIAPVFPYNVNDVSFYKNLATGSFPGYVQKATWTPVSWNGEDYQQFWTVNYQGALWATNGITMPFNPTHIGMQFGLITNVAIVTAGNGTTIPAVANITIGAGTPLVIGDFVFINEVNGITGINFQTGYVTNVVGNVITVTFPTAVLGGAYTTGGIVQYLTNRSDTTKDNIRWYDGDPTNGSPTAPIFTPGKGWVNFMPPLSRNPFSIADLPEAIYYLVGARMIVTFKDRLLFLGPVVQTSSGTPIYLQDTVIYSQNGTPYYTASWPNKPGFPDDPTFADIIFTSILVPVNQTASPASFFEDSPGFGGFISSGLDQPINSVAPNSDVLIIGYNTVQTRFIYTGNDLVPFNFYLINSELGSSSAFSSIIMDKGVITKGSRGYIITTQVEAARIDLIIPDQVFEVDLTQNGNERFCAQRDFQNEWIYFTYNANNNAPISAVPYKFPNQTLFFNYRDNSWAIFNECYTTYGTFRKQTGFTWATVGLVYNTWSEWTDPWSEGASTLLQPLVLAGNQQGFLIIKEDESTSENSSLTIQNIVGSTISSPNHTLNEGDFIIIHGALGTVGAQINEKIFSVQVPTENTFILNPSIAGGTYLGGGTIERMYRPFIQTKQFPVAWEMARKTRIGPQQYLFTTTANSQIQLLIFLSQNNQSPYNEGPIIPSTGSLNDSLIYSTVLFTCPESTNLGLTPANINLQMVTGAQQQQIWHRMNTSLIGDTVQIGFTLSDDQMTTVNEDGTPISQFAEIELHSFILDCSPSQVLA